MKKHLPGFVPVNFKKSGSALLIIGLVGLVAKLISSLTSWFYAPDYFIYLGAGLILLSLYLVFAVPKE